MLLGTALHGHVSPLEAELSRSYRAAFFSTLAVRVSTAFGHAEVHHEYVPENVLLPAHYPRDPLRSLAKLGRGRRVASLHGDATPAALREEDKGLGLPIDGSLCIGAAE
jgi:hypothetical protein